MDKDIETKKPPRNEDVDPELMGLTGTGNQSILQPILMIAIIAMGFWIIGDWEEELSFFFSSSEPVELGDVTKFAEKRTEDPEWSPDLPHNTYVSLSGIPTRRSQSDRYRFFLLVGTDIFVEQEREDYIEDPIEREMKGEQKGDVDRTYYEGEGRLISFAEMPDRYQGLRAYYRSRYNVRFCDGLTERQKEEIRRQKRDAILQQWRVEYKDATPAERKEKGLSLEPSDEELQRMLDAEPVCVDPWLVQDSVKPKEHWWYVAVCGVFVLFMLFNLVLLIRWIRDFLR